MLADIRFALRALRRQPGFALAAIATLAIGIGATVAIFSTVNAAMLRPLPYPAPGDLFALYAPRTDGQFNTGRDSGVEIQRLHDPNVSIVRAAGSSRFETALVRDDGTSLALVGFSVTDGFFELFGLPMTLGRSFRPEEHVPGPTPGVILSYRVWRDRFGSDPQIIGKAPRFLGPPAPIIGVAPRDLEIPRDADVFVPAPITPQSTGHGLDGYVRIKPGTNLVRLEQEMARVMEGLARDYGPADVNRRYAIEPLATAVVGDLRPTLLVVLSASVLLLALAAVNVTNLLLARGAIRSREMALRVAIGAGRGRIARQLLTESLVLAAAGTLAGVALAYAGTRVVLAYDGADLPRLQSIPFDLRVLGFALVAMCVTGLLVGFAPALRLSGTSLKALMAESTRSASGGRSAHRLLRVMVVAEVALAIVLVAGAGWLVRSFANLQRTSPGFATDNRLVVDVMPTQRFDSFEQAVLWSRQTLDYLSAVPGVQHAGSTATFPFRQDIDGVLYIAIAGEPADPNHPNVARARRVTPGFFDAMGIKLIAGRGFTDDDRGNTERVVVVNQAFARRYLNGRDPLSVRFTAGYPLPPAQPLLRVVGVVDDVKYVSMEEPADPMYYAPLMQSGFTRATAVLKTGGDMTGVTTRVREAIRQHDPLMPLRIESLTDLVSATLVRQRLGMTLMTIFAVGALALAAVGIYGVLSYVSSQREGEVATRMAVGATQSDVFWLMVRQGRWLSMAGVLAGLAGAYVAGRVVTSRLFEVRADDPAILAGAAAVVLAITLVAVALPALRTSRVDPSRVLHLD